MSVPAPHNDVYEDARLLELLLEQFTSSDNAWMATFCVTCDPDGLRQALWKDLADRTTR